MSSSLPTANIAYEKAFTIEELAAPSGPYLADDSHPILACKSHTWTRLVVSVYLEGWDPACDESIIFGALSLQVNFRGFGGRFF